MQVTSNKIVIVDKENDSTSSPSFQKNISTVTSIGSNNQKYVSDDVLGTKELNFNKQFDETTHAVETSKIKKSSAKRMSSSISKGIVCFWTNNTPQNLLMKNTLK